VAAARYATEDYPEDWNVFYRYGEACGKEGKKEVAIESYERALALDPSQENPRKMQQR
jgi:tetratricopeptide (TPR) repeat protein